MNVLHIIMFGIINFISNTIQALTGFGGSVLAMPFAVYFFGIKTLIPTFITLGLLIDSYILMVSYKNICLKKYFRMVFYMGLGIPFGIFIFANFSEEILETIIAIFIIIVAIRELYLERYGKETSHLNKSVLGFILFLAGCVQGGFWHWRSFSCDICWPGLCKQTGVQGKSCFIMGNFK